MKRKNIILVLSTIFVVASFILKETLKVDPNFLSLGHYHLITAVVMIITTIIAGHTIFIKAVQALRYKIISIDLLVSIAAIGALIIGEFWEAAAVTFLFIL